MKQGMNELRDHHTLTSGPRHLTSDFMGVLI